jgi:GTPase involved in cell partitioning and DNA repair
VARLLLRVQVGSYAFTTLRPQLGTLASDPAAQEAAGGSASTTAAGGTAESSTAAAGGLSVAAAAAQDTIQGLTGHRLVLADLPGLVPGAHAGRGRGHDFLKHLGKARCIALVVDMTGQAAEGRQSQQQLESAVQDDGSCAGAGAQTGVVVPHGPEQQLEILQQELRLYDASTLSLPCVVVANKVDALSSAAAAARLERLKQATPLPIVPVSAKQRLGLQRLKHALEVVAGSTPAA